MLKLVLLSVVLVSAVSCTSNNPEDKVAAAIENALGKDEFKAKVQSNMDKLMGKAESPFKNSVIDYYMETTKVSVSDIKVDGAKATAKINLTTPNDDEITGMFLMAAFMDQKKLRAMTMSEFINEIAKTQRKTASVKDLKLDKYEGTVDLVEDKEKGWAMTPESMKNFASKKNKVKSAKK